jgi:hypothetical protein
MMKTTNGCNTLVPLNYQTMEPNKIGTNVDSFYVVYDSNELHICGREIIPVV